MAESTSRPVKPKAKGGLSIVITVAVLLVLIVLVWQAFTASGNPDPLAANTGSTVAAFDIGVLVFREGLECILVLAAVTAGMSANQGTFRRPIAMGAAAALGAAVVTWLIVVGILNTLTSKFASHALDIQAATGLVAVIVLLVVMNWFLHKFYWTGWIATHTKKKKTLVESGVGQGEKVQFGLAMVGFWSVYREGFEVVLFLQTYRLHVGAGPVAGGLAVGLTLTAIVGVLTFALQRRLPYKKMLVFTGIMLGVVLLVMVGEQAQEMQLAGWIRTTNLPSLSSIIPAWMGLWFSVFPNVQTLVAQALAAAVVLGSYAASRIQVTRATS